MRQHAQSGRGQHPARDRFRFREEKQRNIESKTRSWQVGLFARIPERAGCGETACGREVILHCPLGDGLAGVRRTRPAAPGHPPACPAGSSRVVPPALLPSRGGLRLTVLPCYFCGGLEIVPPPETGLRPWLPRSSPPPTPGPAVRARRRLPPVLIVLTRPRPENFNPQRYREAGAGVIPILQTRTLRQR